MMNRTLIFTTIFASLLAWSSAFAETDYSGSYKGKSTSSEHTRADFILHSLKDEHRAASYLGLLIMDQGKNVALYQLDPISDHEFTLTPRTPCSDGMMGICDPEPPRVMVIDPASTETNFKFMIVNSREGNSFGSPGITFEKNEKSDFTWDDYTPGVYKLDHRTLQIGSSDTEAHFLAFFEPLNGKFLLRRQLFGVYAVDAVPVTGSGTFTDRYPDKIFIFVRKDDHPYLLSLDPNMGSGARAMKLKRIK